MDKETLSNYGWIVVCIMVLVVMIALATPFGTFIKSGVENTTKAIFSTEREALGVAGLSIDDQSFEGNSDTSTPTPEEIIASGIVPEGASYTVSAWSGVCETCSYDFNTNVENLSNCYCGKHRSDETIRNEVIYTAGQTMPTPQYLDAFRYGDYTYIYSAEWDDEPYTTSFENQFSNASYNGWLVTIRQETSDGTQFSYQLKKSGYGTILSNINGRTVTNMDSTFYCCDSLVDASSLIIPGCITNMNNAFVYCLNLTNPPVISDGITSLNCTFWNCPALKTASIFPNSITSLDNTFGGCTSLTTVPNIPNSVTDIEGLFMCCTSLTTIPTIPKSVTNMNSTFWKCTALTGNIEINATPTDYKNCFGRTTKQINITGSCSNKSVLASTATYGNVTY